ncbi:MAG: arylsulfatase [Planctomycetota bacterium]
MGATGLRVIWLSVWAVVGVIAPVCGRASDGEVSRPPRNRLNIVFILADDLGYGELGCFGQEKIRTPHLDALARDGMRLTQHYAGAPTCAASRCVLLTGRNLAHAEIRGNRDSGNGRPFPGQWPLSPAALTFSTVLRQSGYATGGFGKWGLGPTDSSGSPLNQGFERFFGYNCQRNAHSYYPPFLDDDAGTRALNDPPIPGHRKQLQGEVIDADYRGVSYAPDAILKEALQFIERQREERPFLLYLPFVEPHVAMHPPQAWLDRYPVEWDVELGAYRGENGYLPHSRPRAAYAAMISHLDDHVGKIVDALKQRGLYDRTVIVFTSDNGPTHEGSDARFSVGGAGCRFFQSTGGLRGAKGSCGEGGLRVPTIVRWPGVTNPGASSACLSYFPDWFPTLCRVAGVTLSPELELQLDGVDLSVALAGGGEPKRVGPMFWDFAEYGGIVAAREGKWKAIRRDVNKPQPLAWELYDIEADRAEEHNLAATHPEMVQRLEADFLKTRTVEPDFPNQLYDPLTPSAKAGR